MEAIPQMIIYANKNEHTKSLKQVKLLCKEFGFNAGMLKSELIEGREKK